METKLARVLFENGNNIIEHAGHDERKGQTSKETDSNNALTSTLFIECGKKCLQSKRIVRLDRP